MTARARDLLLGSLAVTEQPAPEPHTRETSGARATMPSVS
jgi:hypothetical protein